MCGIVGITRETDCVSEIISGLQALEYRGYDSSGIACSINNNLNYKMIIFLNV